MFTTIIEPQATHMASIDQPQLLYKNVYDLIVSFASKYDQPSSDGFFPATAAAT
jgi:hypothetical protein